MTDLGCLSLGLLRETTKRLGSSPTYGTFILSFCLRISHILGTDSCRPISQDSATRVNIIWQKANFIGDWHTHVYCAGRSPPSTVSPHLQLSNYLGNWLVTRRFVASILSQTKEPGWCSESLNIYLFIWLHRVLVAVGRLLSCGSLASQLWHVGSLVVACELLLEACMWDLVPWPKIKPRPPGLEVQSLNHCATREVLMFWVLALIH